MRELAARLAACVLEGEGAHLEPQFVEIALTALRDHTVISEPEPMFRIEVLDSQGQPVQVLAVAADELLAHAAYDEALKTNAGQVIRLSWGDGLSVTSAEHRPGGLRG